MMHICVSSQVRGKSCETGKWVEGYLAFDEHGNSEAPHIGYASHRPQEWIGVDPDTVGRCTGLRDKSGALIFEGDVVHFTLDDDPAMGGDKEFIGSVCWDDEMSGYYASNVPLAYAVRNDDEFEIIGNVHDNPELLDEGVR